MRNNNFSIGRTRRKKIAISIASLMAVIIIAMNIWQLNAATGSNFVYLKSLYSSFGMVMAGLLYVGCGINYELDNTMGRTFALIAILIFASFTISAFLDVYAGNPQYILRLLVFQTIINLISISVHIMFWFYQVQSLPYDRRQKNFTVLIFLFSFVYVAICIVNIFKPGFLFNVNADGNFVWTRLEIDLATFFAFYATFLIYLLPQKCSLKKKLTLSSLAVLPLITIALSIVWTFFNIDFTLSSSTSILLLFPSYTVFFCDYREAQEQLLEQKAEISNRERAQMELQTSLMLSQIRPHFLYNALTAIRNLTKTDPDEAYVAIGHFADYLRANMDSIGEGRMIPFDKELEHIKTYLMLEQLRFGDDLKVEYDIQYTDFSLPALTVQPIVENAVKYGATMNEDGGLVRIETALTDNEVCITVSDNGPGFDPIAPMDDGRNHFGIQNVRNSLSTRDCGELVIASEPGKGTTATIIIRGGNY